MPAPRNYRAIVERNVPARMRDGTTLYADVWRPDAPGKFPVLLTRLPYDKSQPRIMEIAGVDPMAATGAGYVVVYQDTRGRFTSEGEWSFSCEFDDGYDTVEWAGALPYSDGNVGMFGISYLGFTQWAAAVTRPPSLRAIFPQQMASSIREFLYPGGAFALGGGLYWAALQAPDFVLRRAAAGEDIGTVMNGLLALVNAIPDAHEALPLAGGNPVLSDVAAYFDEWLEKAEDPNYWKASSYGQRLADVQVPVYQLGGWHDIYNGHVPELFARMRELGGSETARANQKLIVGPWSHGVTGSEVIGDLYFGAAATGAAADISGLHIRWFDQWLKGVDTGILDEPPVRIFVMGDNAWRDEHEWPLARTLWTNYYLHSGGRANTSHGDGGLDAERPGAAEAPDTFVYDPRNPVPTTGGQNLHQGTAIGALAGPREQARVEVRPDVLVYTTPALERDLEVTGPITATLYAATSAKDTDWTVKLVDVHADGRAYNLVEGIVRARYREGMEKPQFVEPGQVSEYEVDLRATSNVFKAGHRIRVQVSSSNFPRFSRNHNTGGPIATETTLVPALQTVLHDADHPSHIRLPVIPR